MTTASGILRFDEETSRAMEAVYATPDVVWQRGRVVESLGLRPRDRVLDVGTGPGFLAHDIAEALGPSGSVQAIDLSPSMLALANRRVPRPGAAPVELHLGDATTLPFEDGSFDVVVSAQVYEYVTDVPRALAEAHRVLAPGGRLLVLDTDWDSVVLRSHDDELTRRVLNAWNEHLVHRDLPRLLPQLLREAGLACQRCDVLPLLNVGYRRESYSGLGLELIVDYVTRQGITSAEAEAWAAGLKALGEDYFFSVSRYVFVATR